MRKKYLFNGKIWRWHEVRGEEIPNGWYVNEEEYQKAMGMVPPPDPTELPEQPSDSGKITIPE